MTWAYKIETLLLRLISNKHLRFISLRKGNFEDDFASTEEYFKRFSNKVSFSGKTVIDVGCGYGESCVYMALHGAKRVVGIDINEERIYDARQKLTEYAGISHIVQFFVTEEAPPKEQFDIVMSKDSFEHYSNPEKFISTMKQYLKPKGIMVIGFSPLWKSPYGGHITSFSSFPWVHLIFSEPVLMQELRRFFQNEKITSYEQIVSGGLNRITYKQFLKLVKENGLEFDYLKTNVASKPNITLRIFKVLSHLPLISDYFIVSIYSILREKLPS